MAEALSQQQLDQIAQQIQANPALLREIQANTHRTGITRADPNGTNPGAGRQDPAAIFRKYGIEFPDAEDYQIQQTPDGKISFVRDNWFQRNADWFVPVSTFATAGIANGVGAAGSVAPPAGGATSTAVPATADTLASTSTIGVSTLPAGGAGISSSAALAGGGTAAGLAGKFGRGAGIASDLAPALGDAAAASADANRQNNADSLAQAYFRVNAPRARLNTGMRADIAGRTTPVHAEWGGPGSGLRGETVHYAGGAPASLSPEGRQLADTTLHNSLSAALTNDTDLPTPGDESIGDKLLGGASLAAGLYGAFAGGQQRRRRTT